MFVDDCVRYPMTFVVEFELSGAIRRPEFQSAIDAALQRHPMLRSMIQPAKASRDCWVEPSDFDSSVCWGELDDIIEVEGASVYIDLRTEIGFRCWCRNDEKQARLTFVFHHAAVDGMGAYQFLGDVLCLYARSTGGDVGELVELPQQALRQRLRAGLGPDLIRLSQQEKLAHEREAAQPLVPRSAESKSQSLANAFPEFQTHTFEKGEFRRIRLAAQDSGQTVNDRLIEACFETALQWNSTFGELGPDDKFAINMPLDLRQADNPMFSAINLVTMGIVLRSRQEIENPEELASLLRTEIATLKYQRHCSEFMQRLMQASLDPDQAAREIDDVSCHATLVFSNAGDPTKRFLTQLPRSNNKLVVGNLLLDDINGVPPLRNQTRAAFSIFTYRRRLRICLRCDPFFFRSEDSKAFLEMFVANFDKSSR